MRRFVQAFSGEPLRLGEWSSGIDETLSKEGDHYNIGKGDDAWVLFQDSAGLHAARFRWGLVPSWSKTPDTHYTTITARLERAARSRIFGKPWKSQHCVIPMNGYYKWDRTTKPAIPYFIQAEDGRPLFVAGLWEHWDRGEPALYSFTILTHPNDAIPPPLTPDGPIFLIGSAPRIWLDGPRLFPAAFLRMAEQPSLAKQAVSSTHRDRSRDDYTLLEPRGAGDYLEPLPTFDSEQEENEDF